MSYPILYIIILTVDIVLYAWILMHGGSGRHKWPLSGYYMMLKYLLKKP